MTSHPIQPFDQDATGVLRFKANAIVRYLLDAGLFDMNQLALLPFTDEDRQQFAQLIGYSLSGYGELDYVSDAAYAQAEGVTHDMEHTTLRTHTPKMAWLVAVRKEDDSSLGGTRQLVCLTATKADAVRMALEHLGEDTDIGTFTVREIGPCLERVP